MCDVEVFLYGGGGRLVHEVIVTRQSDAVIISITLSDRKQVITDQLISVTVIDH